MSAFQLPRQIGARGAHVCGVQVEVMAATALSRGEQVHVSSSRAGYGPVAELIYRIFRGEATGGIPPEALDPAVERCRGRVPRYSCAIPILPHTPCASLGQGVFLAAQ